MLSEAKINEMTKWALSQSRTDSGVSRQEMAKLIDVTVNTIEGWENGGHKPPFYMVYKWFEALELNMFLYFGNSNDVTESIATLVSTLSNEEQIKLQELLKDSKHETLINHAYYTKEMFLQ